MDTINLADLELGSNTAHSIQDAFDVWDLSIFLDPFDCNPPSHASSGDFHDLFTQTGDAHANDYRPGVSSLTQQLFDSKSSGMSHVVSSQDQCVMSTSYSAHLPQHAQCACTPSEGRGRLGRLLAAIPSSRPELLLEDSDTDQSWTSSDNFEDWCNDLRKYLAEFRRCKYRVVIITSPLPTKQRRKVHSMANLLGLSHMSLGSGRNKQILISKCELAESVARSHSSSSKQWNPVRDNWWGGFVDPRIVLFNGITRGMTCSRFTDCLRTASVPQPLRVVLDRHAPTSESPQPASSTAYALFESANDAASALLTLDHSQPNWNSLHGEIQCDYVHFPPGFDLANVATETFELLPHLLQQQEPQPPASFPPDCAVYSDSEDGAGALPSHGRFSSRKTSDSSLFSRDAGYASGASALHSDPGSQGSGSAKKRKRMPRVCGGFPCSWAHCAQVFDRDGDRRKHETNHSAERKYSCDVCGKAFLFAKDLKRHAGTHPSRSSFSSDAVDVVPSGKKGPLTEDRLKQMYGSSPPDRRITKVFSSG